MTFLYFLLALLLLGILVTVHEFGHFCTARLCGIAVREFSVGFGPKIKQVTGKRSGVLFTLRAIPVGGYCAFYGEDDPSGKSAEDPRALDRQPAWKRMLTILMGPGMNFLLALVVTIGWFWIGGMQQVTGVDPFISEVMGTGPAYSAGLMSGDIIEKIDGADVLDGKVETMLDRLQAWRPGDPAMRITVRRGQETFETDITPRYSEADGKSYIDVTVGGTYRTVTVAVSFPDALRSACSACLQAGGMIFSSLGTLFTPEGIEQVSGPVGVVSTITEQVAAGGLNAFLNLLIIISINLGIMNLLPFPGLDGCRFLFLLAEVIRRKPNDRRTEAIIHLIGYGLLLIFILFITFKDILNLIR